jgi:hypothetical protein
MFCVYVECFDGLYYVYYCRSGAYANEGGIFGPMLLNRSLCRPALGFFDVVYRAHSGGIGLKIEAV